MKELAWNAAITESSMASTLKQESASVGNLVASNTLKVTFSSWTRNSSFPSWTSIKALPVAKKGLPRMRGTSLSSSMSSTMKSTGKISLSTFTRTSSMMPLGCLMDRSASCSDTMVGFTSPTPSFLKIERGIRFMLAPKSQRALLK